MKRCEYCTCLITPNEAQVSQWGQHFWHTACFNAERRVIGQMEEEE